MGLSRDQIRAVDDIKREAVTVEEWGGDVWVQALSVRARQQFVKLYGEDAGEPDVSADVWLTLTCACDEDGTRLFDGDDDDAEWLAGKSSRAVQQLGFACLKLNGLTEDAVGEAEKN